MKKNNNNNTNNKNNNKNNDTLNIKTEYKDTQQTFPPYPDTI